VVGPLKGYRLDKIPLGEVVSRVGGQAQFKAACVEHVLIKAQEDVMPVHATRMLPGSERITSDVRGLVNEFDPAKGVTYTLEFDALPAVRWARPYRGIEVTVEETGSLATDEAAVADLIKQYRKDKGRQRVVADRCVGCCFFWVGGMGFGWVCAYRFCGGVIFVHTHLSSHTHP
jgi:FKBP-type peptidyl-prolyl cis-trans isomerase (trigger factor)